MKLLYVLIAVGRPPTCVVRTLSDKCLSYQQSDGRHKPNTWRFAQPLVCSRLCLSALHRRSCLRCSNTCLLFCFRWVTLTPFFLQPKCFKATLLQKYVYTVSFHPFTRLDFICGGNRRTLYCMFSGLTAVLRAGSAQTYNIPCFYGACVCQVHHR